jgi:hypothetical protein
LEVILLGLVVLVEVLGDRSQILNALTIGCDRSLPPWGS